MAEGARLESVYTATYRGFESPLTAIFEMRACTQVRALFFIFSAGGMRTPDRGSTTGAASWTDREPASGLPAGASEASQSPPHRHILRRARTQVRAFFACGTHQGDENPRPGFDNWRSQLDRPRARERAAPQGRAKRVNPPLTAIFEMRACTQVRAFSLYSPLGNENPPTGVRQLAQPVGQTASLRAGCPAGASEASQSPPHRHIRDESLYASTGFFRLWHPPGG